MAKLNPEIAALVNEARQCEIRAEYAEALDVYEEIERRGSLRAEHLIAMGNCLLQTRQRQDARKAWIRAFEMSPENQDVIELLDRHFKGWEKTLGGRRPGNADTIPPPPPPDPGGDATKLSLTVETIAAQERMARPEPPNRPDETVLSRPLPPPRAPAPRREEPAPEFERTGSLRPSGHPTHQVSAPAARPVPQNASRVPAGSQLPPINWDYVMADAMAESGKSAA